MTTATLSRIARVGVLIVAVGAAVLSYRATSHVAAASGAVDPRWSWLAPIIVEAGMVTSGCLAWVRVTTGERARAEIATAAALLTLSVVVQIQDARLHHATALGMVLSAAPPIVLLAAAEQVIRELRRVGQVAERAAETERRAVERRASRAQRGQARAARPEPSRDGDYETPPASRPGQASMGERASEPPPDPDDEVTRLVALHGDRLTGAQVAAALALSDSQGRRRLAAWRERQAADPKPAA